jgi:hypothetical protein
MSAPLSIREVEWERPPLFEPKPDAELERWAQANGSLRVYPLRFFVRCRYCYAAARFFLRLVGIPEARIAALEGDLVAAELEPRSRLGLEFARRLSRSNPPPGPADVEGLRDAGFSREEILELAFVTAQYVVINRVTTFVAMPPERLERVDRGWVARLMRPLTRRMVRARRARRSPVSLSAEAKRGPFASAVVGLDGLPVAGKLRQILDES